MNIRPIFKVVSCPVYVRKMTPSWSVEKKNSCLFIMLRVAFP